jgi:hypothetical protein
MLLGDALVSARKQFQPGFDHLKRAEALTS